LIGWRASVLDCGSPLPLLHRQSCREKSGRWLPQSKTSRNFSGALANHGCKFIETAMERVGAGYGLNMKPAENGVGLN